MVLLLVPPALRNFVRILSEIDVVDHSNGFYGVLSTKEGPGPTYLVNDTDLRYKVFAHLYEGERRADCSY